MSLWIDSWIVLMDHSAQILQKCKHPIHIGIIRCGRGIKMIDWCKAEEHLDACEKVYSIIDSAGYLVLNYVVLPLRSRLTKGERSEELWHDIMEIQL